MKEKLEAMRAYFAMDRGRLWLGIVALAAILALIVTLGFAIRMHAGVQRSQEAARNRIGENLYADLNLMMQTFDMTNVPAADVQNVILPQMKELFHGAVALNEVLGDVYSAKYQVLTPNDVSAIESAFSTYETAFRDGTSTDLAQSNMMACMVRIRELLDTRYAGGVLRALR